MSGTPLPIDALVMLSQYAKTPGPRWVTLSGTVTLSRFQHKEKAPFLILVTLPGMLTLPSPLDINALYPISRILSGIVTLISLFLDNVTTVLVFAPLTVVICRMLGLNPMPFLMSEALLSDTGGVATLVGDPPNVMIGSAAGIDFNRFLFHMGPIILVAWALTVVMMLVLFRGYLVR